MRLKRTVPLIAALACAAVLALSLGACTQIEQAAPKDSGQLQGSNRPQGIAEDGHYGSPWVSAIFAGNLPFGRPHASDDFYLYCNYDFIKNNTESAPVTASTASTGEVKAAIISSIEDEELSNHEYEQLRIFYDQALDVDALEYAGADELRPYLQEVQYTETLDELESVLTSSDFPFNPWIKTTVSAIDMKSTMCITVLPNLLFSDPSEGADIYQDSSNETMVALRETTLEQRIPYIATALQVTTLAVGYSEAVDIADRIFELEKAYAKEGDYLTKYLDAPYGARAQSTKHYTLDELVALCPNVPLNEMLDKYGQANGESYIVLNSSWLEEFNKVWTEENFELLRAMTIVKMMLECKDVIAPSYFSNARAILGQPEPTHKDFAYTACDKIGTFGHLLAKIYVEEELDDKVLEQLEEMTNGIVDAYVDLIKETPWLNDESRENVLKKIDNMAFNILHPDGGYQSFDELELVPTKEGGTLFSNYLRLLEYHERCEADLVGKPARASDTWFYYNPTMANCFYEPLSNSINIYPGYLTRSMYSKRMYTEELLGGIGFVIAHEISHAFDYTGSQYSAFGEAQPIYSDADVDEFVAISDRLAKRFSAIELQPGCNVDGTAVSAEAMADLCGLQAIVTYADTLPNIYDDRLFEIFARNWAAVYPFSYVRYFVSDSHPPSNLRVNVSAQMLDEFYEIYDVAPGDAMYLAPEDRVLLWGPNAG